MYDFLKRIFFPILKVEETHPHPPAGHEADESLQIVRASPSYLRLRLFLWKLYAVVWGLGVLSAAVALVIVDSRFLWLVIPLVAVAAFKAAALYVTTRLDYDMRWYVITDRSLLIRQGVWNVREITLTFANAQNVQVKQGPVQRIFGISDVLVETAGGGGGKEEQGSDLHRAVLRGVDNPEEIRDRILELLRRHRSAGLGDPDDHLDHSTALAPHLLAEILDEAKRLRAVVASSKSLRDPL